MIGAPLALAGILAAVYLYPISMVGASVAGIGLFGSGAALITYRVVNDRKQKNLSKAESNLALALPTAQTPKNNK